MHGVAHSSASSLARAAEAWEVEVPCVARACLHAVLHRFANESICVGVWDVESGLCTVSRGTVDLTLSTLLELEGQHFREEEEGSSCRNELPWDKDRQIGGGILSHVGARVE